MLGWGMDKKTPLYNWHLAQGGKIVPFGGYLMPIQYEKGLIAEHMAVRERAGLFDVSHMGEFIISGSGALKAIQRLFTNDFSNLKDGGVRYTLMCNEEGGIIDDLIIYRLEGNRYLLVVNASNREKDAAWIKKELSAEKDAVFEDISDSMALIALQGPASPGILALLCETIPPKYYSFI